jgi:integrase
VIEFVYRPSRRKRGKKVVSPCFFGRYSLGRGQKPVTVCLETKDAEVAKKRLRDIVVEKQRELAGIIVPKAVSSAAAAPILDLIGAYEVDLKARDLRASHVVATVRRLQRMVREMKLSRLWDIDAVTFVKWRGGLKCAAKTKKEYQVSMNAFLRWLIATKQLLANPLAGVAMIDTRGREVRRRRALTKEEIERLLAVAGKRRLSYLFLLYTGFRFREAWGMRWCDLELDGVAPFVRLERTFEIKDREGRIVPLHPVLF